MYQRLWSAGQPPLFTPPPASPIAYSPNAQNQTNLTPQDALEAATSTLSLDAQKRAAKDAQKKAAKAEAAEQKHAATLASSKVYIKRVERNKRKYVTAVSGLETFGLDLKKVARDFGKKFATGSSVTKLASGGEEIVVQGDVSDEIEEFLMENYKVIPEDNIELIEDKKKKGAGAGG
jgi:density-regulated protein